MDEEKKKTILVVDDEPDIRLFLKTVLEDAGFEVMTADNGKHALERIKDHKPDLISLDLVMPRMGGLKLLKYLQKNPKLAGIPFIVVTAHARDELGREDFLKLKAGKFLVSPHSYMEKPVVPSEYIKMINKRLGLEQGEISDVEDLKARIMDRIATAKKEKLEETLKTLAE
ncbi:MAG: response regulator [Deltaproteobacteria bacterium]|nr:response regulator [Deltaproteobacteria bacterium]